MLIINFKNFYIFYKRINDFGIFECYDDSCWDWIGEIKESE